MGISQVVRMSQELSWSIACARDIDYIREHKYFQVWIYMIIFHGSPNQDKSLYKENCELSI